MRPSKQSRKCRLCLYLAPIHSASSGAEGVLSSPRAAESAAVASHPGYKASSPGFKAIALSPVRHPVRCACFHQLVCKLLSASVLMHDGAGSGK